MTNGVKEKLLVVGSGGFGRVTYENATSQYDCSFVDDGSFDDKKIKNNNRCVILFIAPSILCVYIEYF